MDFLGDSVILAQVWKGRIGSESKKCLQTMNEPGRIQSAASTLNIFLHITKYHQICHHKGQPVRNELMSPERSDLIYLIIIKEKEEFKDAETCVVLGLFSSFSRTE